MAEVTHPEDRAETEALHAELLPLEDGALHDGIPALAAADPRAFGLALASADGEVYRAGEAEHPFTVQSAAKPFVYALALADAGRDAVLERVGEATRDAGGSARSDVPESGDGEISDGG